MRAIDFDRGWKLTEGTPSKIPLLSGQTKTVNLPHDYVIGGEVAPDAPGGAGTGYYKGGTYTYTKEFEVPASWEGREISLSFDGVYGETQVLLNGCLLGRHSYGYTPFSVGLEKKLYYGSKNRLQVVVSNDAEPNSRWYSGGGIYRHVKLFTGPKLHIAQNGIFAHTSHIVDKDAFVVVEATVENHTGEDADVWVELRMYLLGDRGKARLEKEPGEKAAGAVRVYVPAGERAVARTQLLVADAAVWDIDSPRLYSVEAKLYQAVREDWGAPGAAQEEQKPAGAACEGQEPLMAAREDREALTAAQDGQEAPEAVREDKKALEAIREDKKAPEAAREDKKASEAAQEGQKASAAVREEQEAPAGLLAGRACSVPHAMKELDAEETRFGIRTITMDARYGFRLNGRPVKLKGGCIHHDNGILGAASFGDSEYRKVKLHKDNGYNALRFAHNPVSTEMLEACDRLGILAIDEAFDTWNVGKNLHDFSQRFGEQWERELAGLIVRDRNHPCVIIWSVGNELPEQGGLADGCRTSRMLAEKVRELDDTRFVGGALSSFFWGLDDRDTEKFWQSLLQEPRVPGGLANFDGAYGKAIWNDYTESFCAPWDVVGYNYLNYHYQEAAELFPNRVICATESKPRQMEEYWDDVLRFPQLIGDFEWTSHDYIGEAGIGKRVYAEPEEMQNAAKGLHEAPYPWRTAGTGEFDLCGFAKPQLAYRRILWGSQETYIAVRNPENRGKTEILDRYAWPDCANSWTWPVEEESPVEVEVYSAAEEVEILLNGQAMGRARAGKENHNRAAFTLPYRKGTLRAVSYTGGNRVSEDEIVSVGQPAGIAITLEKQAFHQEALPADGQALAFAKIEIVDQEGRPVPNAEIALEARVQGNAVLQAFGTGRCRTEENYASGRITSFEGRALAVVRAGYEEGGAKLIVKADGLEGAELDFAVVRDCKEIEEV